MRIRSVQQRFLWLGSLFALLAAPAPVALAQTDNPLVGIWAVDEGFQVVEYLFRSDGRFQRDTRSTDPDLDFSFTDRGRYEINGTFLTLTPYEYLGAPEGKPYEFQLNGDLLTLTTVEFPVTQTYQLRPGSRADVLAREAVDPVLIGAWTRTITFFGKAEYTFRPGGYYVLKNTPEDSQFPPDYIRGRYVQDGNLLLIKPYSGVEAAYELDFFGTTLTLIRAEEFLGESTTYEEIPGSEEEVRAKSAEAEAFLNREHWQVGVWEIRDGVHTVDLTLRPDGHYISTNATEILRGIVRGRYTLEPGQIELLPYVGQGLYSRDNGDFGKVGRARAVDYYDGELQLIDLTALSQSVAIARKRAGSEALVLEKTLEAQTERAREGWHLGIWEVNDPNGWMELTFRPDNRYILKSGTGGVPGQVERGRYLVRNEKVTLAPYPGNGAARGFELDLYDGDLFLAGDLNRLVVARKIADSEIEVTRKTDDPDAVKGERGSILGLWTAPLPGQFEQLVFRQDGQFRLSRCMNDTVTWDYGLYSVNMSNRTLVSDSRFVTVQSLELDFYGDTMTIYGGASAPSTYTVNLGSVDSAIAASFDEDAAEALIDAQWMARVPIGPKDPNAVQLPGGGIPADPNPGRIFNDPTVFTNFQFYRRFTLGVVVFNELGTIRTVNVLNSREWYFFPTGRTLVRFRNHSAGPFYPTTIENVSDTWGAYRIGPKPDLTDILHIYADNGLFIETDTGEAVEMTLEDGRRHLFWGKDYQLLGEWATEQKPIPCDLPAMADPSLMNTGVSLTTTIAPDEMGGPPSIEVELARTVEGDFRLIGTTTVGGAIITETATTLASPIPWRDFQTNTVAAGAFEIPVPQGTNAASYFRVRMTGF